MDCCRFQTLKLGWLFNRLYHLFRHKLDKLDKLFKEQQRKVRQFIDHPVFFLVFPESRQYIDCSCLTLISDVVFLV